MRSFPASDVAREDQAPLAHLVIFASRAERASRAHELRAAGCAVSVIEVLGAEARGRLGEVLDEAASRALLRAKRQPEGAAEAHAPSQLAGPELVVMLPTLSALAGPDRTLDASDCASLRSGLRRWAERTLVVLDAGDEDLAGLLPVPLAQALASKPNGPIHWSGPALGPPPRAPGSSDLSLDDMAERDLSDEGRSAARKWIDDLGAARGPQPLVTLERLFAESYVPLANAIASGLEDARARSAHDEFREAFRRSYTDTFPTFAATSKRPRLVLDAHDVASRIARLHGARSTRLLLVDAMRFDLSRLILSRLSAKVGARAAITDELVLWSALPTVTLRQLETLARGVEALRAPSELEPDGEPPRGRTAEYVRRLRVGPREIHKLDVVEARLQGARGAVLRMLPEIADQTAEIIARHAESLAPHTLLFVFGDHGFTVERGGGARQGGASPEEVLVGAFALLVGDVH